jgi:hypothetical protein
MVVALPAGASGWGLALSCGTPGASGPSGVNTAPSAHPTAGSARAHRRPVGAGASAPASTETADGPSGGRSSPDCGGHALGGALGFPPFANCLSVSGRGPRCPAAISAGAKRASGHAYCKSSFRPKQRSLRRLDLCNCHCSTKAISTVAVLPAADCTIMLRPRPKSSRFIVALAVKLACAFNPAL